jgi:Ser-tRNA(Ala) deacylase AlaX
MDLDMGMDMDIDEQRSATLLKNETALHVIAYAMSSKR